MKPLRKIMWVLVSATTPLLIVLSTIRLALTPLFITFEYRLPGFPPDLYGFSQAERLGWARFSIHYLLGKISHNALEMASLADGSPLFNNREIVHMLDVRNLTTAALTSWYFLLLFLLAAFFFAWQKKDLEPFFQSIQRGASATLLLIFSILLAVWLNFNWLFTKFHEIFFEDDSWLFHPTDHLIRLFPLRFWQDLFIFIGGVSVIISLGIILSLKATWNSPKRTTIKS